jgi:hypothetical protein
LQLSGYLQRKQWQMFNKNRSSCRAVRQFSLNRLIWSSAPEEHAKKLHYERNEYPQRQGVVRSLMVVFHKKHWKGAFA